MYKALIIVISLSFAGCKNNRIINGKSLQDTLKAIERSTDYRPLKSADAYNFINTYYLPRLDTMPTGRKIFIYPIGGVDFKKNFEISKERLSIEYSGDTTQQIPNLSPTIFSIDSTFKWDGRKLLNTRIIKDSIAVTFNDKNIKYYKLWHSKYGYGYMCISYPQYNANTNRLEISEWLENSSFCGTGRNRKFYYNKIPGGWKIDD
jgi:hypothetical protein